MNFSSKPQVSIIIPTYNAEKYISQAIDSILNQTYDNYEIIVVDDGSTDDTYQVLAPYQEHIRYSYQENQGVAISRNSGMAMARGDLIAFLDADDFFLPQKLAKQVACFEKDANLGMVISGWCIVDGQGKKIFDVEPWKCSPQLNLTTAVLHKPARPSATMIRRQWCEGVGGFDSFLASGEDLDLLLRLMLLDCPAIWLSEVLVGYRQHSRSLMSQGMTLIENTTTVMERFFARPNLPPAIRQLESQEKYHCCVWLACRMYYDGYHEEMSHCLQEAWQYSDRPPETVAFNWLESFKNYALEYGHDFDVYSLVNSPAWEKATNNLTSVPTLASPTVEKVTDISHTPKQILLYTDDLGIGGVRQYNHSLVCHLAQMGYQVTHVYCQTDNPLSDREQELGVHQLNLGYHAASDRTRSLRDIEGLSAILRQTQPDLIIFSDGWPFSNLAAKQAALELGIPYLIVLGFIEPSCIQFTDEEGISYVDLVNYQYSQAQKAIAVSQENLNLLRRLFQLPSQIGRVIHYGRPSLYFQPRDESVRERLRQELNIPPEAVVCFTAARLEPVKGYQYQLEAIKELKNSSIWSELYFVWAGTGAASGDNSNEAELKQTVAELGVGGRVIFLGQRWDIADLLDASDIFILTSEAEGMPLSIMEAMAKGLPVIASGVSGIPEELGNTGKLLPNPKLEPTAAVADLIETIQLWTYSAELRKAKGQECQQRATEMFQESTMLARYETEIKQILADKKDEDKAITHPRTLRIAQNSRTKLAATSTAAQNFYYLALVWQAWFHYRQGDLAQTTTILQESLQYSPHTPTLTVFNWLKNFTRFATAKGETIDVYSLINSAEWQKLEQLIN